MPRSLATAAEELAQRYPQVPVESVRMILDEAHATVIRLLGGPDVETAIDLAQLRLDVRTRRIA